MTRLEVLIREMEEAERTEEAEELRGLRGSELRRIVARAPQIQAERNELASRLGKLEKAPLVQAAFQAAGIDARKLSKLERKAIESYDGELDEEAIHGFLAENEIEVAQ